MKVAIDLKTPSIINKLLELAPAMLGRGGKLSLEIDVKDSDVAKVLGDYFTWAGMLPAPGENVEPEAVDDQEPEADDEPETVDEVRDAAGVPHNPELHAPLTGRTGGRNADGKWKMRKGADRGAYAQWAAQYSGPAGTPVTVTVTPPPVANPFAVVAQLEDPGEEAVAAKATALATSGVLTPSIVNGMMAEFNCDSIAFLKDPGVRPRVWARLGELEKESVRR